MKTTENKQSTLEKPSVTSKWNLSRRKFLQLMLGAAAAPFVDNLSLQAHSDIAPATEQAAAEITPHATAEIEQALTELDTDFISNPLSSDSLLLDQRNNPNSEIQTAAAEKTLDEPVSEIVSVETIREIDSLGKNIEYRQYQVKYNDEQFTVRAEIVDSQDTSTLHFQFNEGYDSTSYVNKPIMKIVFNVDSDYTNEMNKVTVYCLESYDASDTSAANFSLSPAFYKQQTDASGAIIFRLDEEFTMRHFAQGLNPQTMKAMTEACGIKSYNHLRSIQGGKGIRNSSIILSKKFTENYGALAHNPPDNFYSDDGGLFNTDLTDTEKEMQRTAAIQAHELAHATSQVFKDDQPWHIMGLSGTRDDLQESWADMCRSYYWHLVGNDKYAESYYSLPLSAIFMPDTETSMYNFKSYQPILFSMLLKPYAKDLATTAGTAINQPVKESSPLAELHYLQQYYLLVRDKMLEEFGSSWYVEWWDRTSSWSHYRASPLLRAHADTYAPLLYAERKAKNPQAIIDKNYFMEEVVNHVEGMAFSARVQLLENLFMDNPVTEIPYIQDRFNFSWDFLLQAGDQSTYNITLPVPALKQTIEISRKVDPLYTSSELEYSSEYYYRQFYPYYYLHQINPAPPGQEFVLTKNSSDEEFLVVILESTSQDPNQDASIRKVLRQGEQVIVHPDQKNIVSILDKRPSQIKDDLSSTQTPIFAITSQERTTPIPEPEPVPPPEETEPEPPPVVLPPAEVKVLMPLITK